jgi:CRP-like cAMP-binding protein
VTDFRHAIRSSEGIERVVVAFQRWLHIPDPGQLYVVLATVAANRMAGDPVWTVLVGPPGGGKTEAIASLGDLPEVHFAATLTEAALLSGTPKRDKTRESTGGLLKQVGDYGIVVCKDFTSVLAMASDSRGQVLAALREVYDGSWTRLVGTDGGRTLHWSGKCGMVAGCTPTIDRHHAVMGAMGERFVLYRLPSANADEIARRSLEHVGSERAMRDELRGCVRQFFDALSLPDAAPRPSPDDTERLIILATFAVRARSAVERDNYSREIELIPEPEAPTRLVNVLARMLGSLRIIGVTDEWAWRTVAKLALDSIPQIRRDVLEHLVDQSIPVTTATVCEACGYPKRTAERALEDLVAHGLVTVKRYGPGKATEWRISEWAEDRWRRIATSPDIPDGADSPLNSPLTVSSRKTGEVAFSGLNPAVVAESSGSDDAEGPLGMHAGHGADGGNAAPPTASTDREIPEAASDARRNGAKQMSSMEEPAAQIERLAAKRGGQP